MKNQITVDFSALERVARLLVKAGNDLLDETHVMPSSAWLMEGGGMRVNVQKSFRCTPLKVSASNVSEALREYRRITGALGEHAMILAYRVQDASDKFCRAEQSARGDAQGQQTSPPSTGGTSAPGSSGSWFRWEDVKFSSSDIWKFIKTIGPIGAGISVIGEWLTGGKDWKKTALKSAKDLASFVEKTAKIASKSSFDWKTLFDLHTSSNVNGIAANFGKQIDKYNFGKAMNVSGKIAVGAKWAGSILTVLTSYYDNVVVNKEGNTKGRAYAETVMESGIKIGEDILIGTLIGAGVAALGGPAIVAGAATVGVIWAADRICEGLTGGRDVAEFVTDVVIDNVIPAVKDVADGVINFGKNCVNAAGKAISGWWNGLTGGWKPAVSGGSGR